MAKISREEYFQNIISTLGTTNIWTATGFIAPDGSMINLSNTKLYPDPSVCYYTHDDLEPFFGFKLKEILLNGAIKIGYGDINDIPYAQIVLKKHQPTNEQWNKIEELLNTEPKMLDLEVEKTPNIPLTSFYKRYNADEHTIVDIKRDIDAYVNGDKTNIGSFSEKLGIKEETE